MSYFLKDEITCPNCKKPKAPLNSLCGTCFLATMGIPTEPKKSRVSFILAWYDFWVGFYLDTNKRKLYILPIPCVGIVIQL